MRRCIGIIACLAVAGAAKADLLEYTLSGTVTSFTDQTGMYTTDIQVGDNYTFQATIDTSAPPLSATLWAASYRFVGPTTITIGSFVHQVTQDAASRPFGDFDAYEGPFPDPYMYEFEGEESKGDFTMKDGNLASLGEVNDSGYLEDFTNSAFSSLAPPTSINVNSFSQSALLFTNEVFDYESDMIDPAGDIVSTAHYKTDSVVATLNSVTIQPALVPEPSCLLALGFPILSLGLRKRSSRK
jgi:hypothetical protein